MLMLWASAASAYAEYDLSQVLPKGASKTDAGLDLVFLDQVLNDLSTHALYYPPIFANEDEQARAVADVRLLIKVMQPITKRKVIPSSALLRLGLLHLLAWNLEIPNSQPLALKYLQAFLRGTPNDGYANYLLGVYYAGTAKQQQESILPLNRAILSGYPQAYYTLALVYYSLGDKARTLENLRLYASHFPNDTDTASLIQAIDNGSLRVER